ncbi:MAG: type II CAAX endopeptidase family protein [Vicinamibacterales bacterium]
MADIDEITPAIPPIPELPEMPASRPTWPTWVEILLCSGYPTQILIGQLLVSFGIAPIKANGSLSGTFVFALSIADTVLLLSLIILFLRRRGENPSEVFFGQRPARAEVTVGILSFPVIITLVMAMTLAIRAVAPSLHNVAANPLEGLIGTGANIWLFLMVVIVAGGVREELQRAFLLHRFRGDLGQPWLGLLITSLSFGIGHTLQGLDAAIITGTLGAAWGALYLLRRGALASVVSHSVFNAAQLIAAFLR